MRGVLIAAVLCLAVMGVSAQNEYGAVRRARAANRSVYGLRSMSDGEHYTVNKGTSIVRCAYTDSRDTATIVKAGFRMRDYAFSPDEHSCVFADSRSVRPIYRHSYTADYWLSDADGNSRKILDAVRDVAFSPDGSRLAFSRGNDLYLYEIATGISTRITDDGEWNAVINGTSDWVYEEEYGFTRAYAFSTDGRRIAYLRFDESCVPTFEMMRYDGSLYNRAYSFKYPKAGDANSVVSLWVYDIATGRKSLVDTGANTDQYILNLSWTPADELCFYRVNRLQNHFEVVLQRNDGTQKVIYDECSPCYVERPDASSITFIDSRRFVVREETTTGYMHLYLHDVERGRLHAVTSGEWEVADLVGFDGKRLYYLSTEQSPLCRDLYSVALNGKGKRRLTVSEGFCAVQPSKGMKYYVQTTSNAATPNVVTVHRNDGSTIDTLADSRKRVAAVGQWPAKQFSQFVTERGDTLNCYIQLPADFDAAKRYPVLLTQYSGPGSQQVRNRWSLDWEDAMAAKGYIVACCDGRGTGFRGEKFKKQTYRDLGRLETEDQLSFARYMAALPYVDADRIGIYGWSYGGFMALNCALHGNGLFRMAIAVAPVTSWRYYDTIYTEIYNGLPQDNAAGYDDNSPIAHAAKLSPHTRLLIIHGTADDNVHFQNTMEMCRALNKAGKQYDMMVYPDQNHSMLPDCTSAIRQKMIDYASEHL
ncbi:MAG: S9 family peptidase [Alistipes sp.]